MAVPPPFRMRHIFVQDCPPKVQMHLHHMVLRTAMHSGTDRLVPCKHRCPLKEQKPKCKEKRGAVDGAHYTKVHGDTTVLRRRGVSKNSDVSNPMRRNEVEDSVGSLKNVTSPAPSQS
jgi:hypothetical protein